MSIKTNKIKLLATGVFLCNYLAAQANVKVEINNIPRKNGTLWIAWYDNADDFKKVNRSLYRKNIQLFKSVSYTTSFPEINPGRYAIAVFFDENGNNKLDKNVLGIPTESYGFSNNADPIMRSATYEESRFSVKQHNRLIVINLH